MREDNLLQQAITAARAGQELTARDMFLRIVQVEPQNELAWMWLIGLHDHLDEKIYACEQIMAINPRNAEVETYLARLLVEQKKIQYEENQRAEEKMRGIHAALKAGKKNLALQELRVLALNPQLAIPDAWRLLAELTPLLDERVRALENLATLVDDEQVKADLEQARHFQRHPIHQAELYEEQGDMDNALLAYRAVALKTPADTPEWKRIYWKIAELENRQQERIAHISPVLNIARLTAGPPLVYLVFALLHVGINPLANFDPVAWIGLLWEGLGSFMVALATVRSHNRLWLMIFNDASGSGTPLMRRLTALAGWVLILLPYGVMFYVAWTRLMDYLFKIFGWMP